MEPSLDSDVINKASLSIGCEISEGGKEAGYNTQPLGNSKKNKY
jgi:hypothetical protein